MRVYRNVKGVLEDAAVNPGDLVFLFPADQRPIACTLPEPPKNAHGNTIVDYAVLDENGWWYAFDGVGGLREWETGEAPDYKFKDR